MPENKLENVIHVNRLLMSDPLDFFIGVFYASSYEVNGSNHVLGFRTAAVRWIVVQGPDQTNFFYGSTLMN